MKRKINYSELLLSGIYFLISEGEVVYVGETDCIARRIGEHNGNKTFDNFNFFSSKTFFWMDSKKHREYAEAKCIRKFKPKYNKNKHNYYAPFYSFKPSTYSNSYRFNGTIMGEFYCFGVKEVADELGISMEEAEPIFNAREDELEEKHKEWEKTQIPNLGIFSDIIKQKYGGSTIRIRPPTKEELGYP